jgi:lipoate---protein ligase
MIELEKYSIPDIELINNDNPSIFTWLPDKTYVVLGQRDSIDTAINEDSYFTDVVFMQRPSGGHSVVLTPKTFVVAMTSSESEISNITNFFRTCNTIIIKALQKQIDTDLHIKGISDIVLGNQKIVGSSMYRTKSKLFFHAVINISESPEYISKFLKHPVSEPDYRQKRDHKSFITSLSEKGYKINLDILSEDLKSIFCKSCL